MFRHVVMFRWAAGVDAAAKKRAQQELASLSHRIPQVRAFRFGHDAGLNEDNFDLAVVADFDDQASYEAYSEHPAHLSLVREVLAPIVEQRAAVQHALE